MTNALTLITPTGERPEAFALCERWMARQTFQGCVQWLVVDDGSTPTAVTLGQQVLRPVPVWQPGRDTQIRNILAALPQIKYDKVLFIEDDDWYGHEFLAIMSNRLDDAALVGEVQAHYYHVGHRRFRVFRNHAHSSLGQVGIRGELVELLHSVCSGGRHPLIDIELCHQAGDKRFYPWSGTYLGIKGLPGRPGITSSHRDTQGAAWVPDLDLSVLRQWLGEDVAYYQGYYDA